MTYREVMTRLRLSAVIAAGTIVASVALAGPASADGEFTSTAKTWAEAATDLGMAGSLWQPTTTAGLKLKGAIDDVADNLTFVNGKPTTGDTFAGGQYGSNKKGFQLSEKWANTGWAAEPGTDIRSAPVGSVTIKLGEPGTTTSVKAKVYANCYTVPAKNPKPAPASFRCTKADVAKTGGKLVMTAKPPSTMTAPGNTSIIIESQGISYDDLIAIASGLTQVMPAIDADSAMTKAICSQMVDGSMSQTQANALAVGNGYTTRVGTIDGVPQAVTMDYRPDRFTLTLNQGVVTACPAG